jgi:hypothetical protein
MTMDKGGVGTLTEEILDAHADWIFDLDLASFSAITPGAAAWLVRHDVWLNLTQVSSHERRGLVKYGVRFQRHCKIVKVGRRI